MARWLQIVHRWVVGGEAWAAAYSWLSDHGPKIWEWAKERWPSLLAMASAWGIGTWFASSIKFINDLGWGAWPFVGAVFALLVAATFWLFSQGSLRRAQKNSRGITLEGGDAYSISRICLFCNSALDPASDALHLMINERLSELGRDQQIPALFVDAHKKLAIRLTKGPSDKLNALLQKERDGVIRPSECEFARILREYSEGYIYTLRQLVQDNDIRSLVKLVSYKEWRFRHRELQRIRGEMSSDRRLQGINSIIGCILTVDEQEYPEPAEGDRGQS